MSANPVQKASKSMSAKVCMSQMTLSSYLLFQLSVPTVLTPQVLEHRFFGGTIPLNVCAFSQRFVVSNRF
jgi:hypothetical protein